jgi:tetratricopeptide (TPR) repeat protein
MAHRKKHRSDKSAPKKVAMKARPSWVLGAIVLAGAILLTTSPYWFPRQPVKQLVPTPAPKNSIAFEKAPPGPPAGSTVMVSTNDAESVDVDKSTDLQNRGTDSLAKGKLDEAVAQFKEAVKLNPEDEDAHYNLALAFARKENRDAAKKEYLEALRIYPDYAEAHNNLGNLLVSEGKFTEAVEHFQATLKISPENASAHNNLGNALARQGKVNEAIASFSEALRLKPDYIEARFNLGNAYLNRRRIDEAIFEFTEILRRQPDFGPARRGLAKAEQLRSFRNPSSPSDH